MKPEKTQENKQIPPYVPFKAFKSFVERLHGTAIPPAIDPSLLQNMSGSARSQLMSCLRFLDLIGTNGIVNGKFRQLIKSYKTETWNETLKNIVFESYHTVTSDVDLDSGTDAQLVTAFKVRCNVEGQVLDKAKRFYLSALTEVGFKYSPHFGTRKPPTRRPVGIRKPKKKNDESPPDDEDEGNDESPDSSGAKMERFRFPIRGKGQGTIMFPQDMNNSDWTVVRKMLDAYFETM
jgi:hypothetical protein